MLLSSCYYANKKDCCVQTVTIVGGGRVGAALKDMCEGSVVSFSGFPLFSPYYFLCLSVFCAAHRM